jgi:hypothetical protein
MGCFLLERGADGLVGGVQGGADGAALIPSATAICS